MPIALLDDAGTRLYYEDSGAPSANYTTLVLVHGSGFHSGKGYLHTTLIPGVLINVFAASFQRMIPCAAEHNLRLIIPNLRDYPHSTPYTAEELEDLRGPSRERQEKALQSRGLELAAFLKEVVKSDPSIGPMSLLAWSAGHCQTNALFAYADHVPKDTIELLNTHLRSYILYGTCFQSA